MWGIGWQAQRDKDRTVKACVCIHLLKVHSFFNIFIAVVESHIFGTLPRVITDSEQISLFCIRLSLSAGVCECIIELRTEREERGGLGCFFSSLKPQDWAQRGPVNIMYTLLFHCRDHSSYFHVTLSYTSVYMPEWHTSKQYNLKGEIWNTLTLLIYCHNNENMSYI